MLGPHRGSLPCQWNRAVKHTQSHKHYDKATKMTQCRPGARIEENSPGRATITRHSLPMIPRGRANKPWPTVHKKSKTISSVSPTRRPQCWTEYRDDFYALTFARSRGRCWKPEAGGRGFQHLPRDLANVSALKNHVRSLLLHKNWKHLLHFALVLALFCFAFSPMSRECNFKWLCSF